MRGEDDCWIIMVNGEPVEAVMCDEMRAKTRFDVLNSRFGSKRVVMKKVPKVEWPKGYTYRFEK